MRAMDIKSKHLSSGYADGIGSLKGKCYSGVEGNYRGCTYNLKVDIMISCGGSVLDSC